MALVALEPKLTTLPDVFVRISEVLNDPLSTSREAAEAIGRDTGLSAVLLRLVNSAFYGFPVKVDTLSRAVTIVGSRQLTTLALGLSVLAFFKDLPEDLVDMERGGADIDEELVNTVFRAAHSIKGGAGFLNLNNIRELSHRLEGLLHMIRSRELVPDTRIINLLLAGFDRLLGLVESAADSDREDISSMAA